jgi:hypothetical protein
MMTRTPLRILVCSLPLILVAFAITLGTGALCSALGDESLARGLRIGSLILGVLLALDVVLLVGCLGLRAVMQDEFRATKGKRGRLKRGNRQGRHPRSGR